MATFSKKMMGKEVGDAKVYAKPHTMSGKVVKASTNPGKEPNRNRQRQVAVGYLSGGCGEIRRPYAGDGANAGKGLLLSL